MKLSMKKGKIPFGLSKSEFIDYLNGYADYESLIKEYNVKLTQISAQKQSSPMCAYMDLCNAVRDLNGSEDGYHAFRRVAHKFLKIENKLQKHPKYRNNIR